MAIDSINPMVDQMIVQNTVQPAVKPANTENTAAVNDKDRVSPVSESGRIAADNRVNPGVDVAEVTPASRDQLEGVIEQLNELMRDSQRSLSFRVDDDLDKLVVSVVNPETDEIIRQMPSEESLKFAKSLEGVMGIIFNERA